MDYPMIDFVEEQSSAATLCKVFAYHGIDVRMRKTNNQVQVCVSDFAKAFPNKNLGKIANSQEIRDYVNKLSEITNVISTDLLQVKKGGNPSEQGTWAQAKVALRISQKLSTEFSIWVDEHIDKLLSTGYTSVLNQQHAQTHPIQTPIQALLVCVQQMAEQEQKMNLLESRIDDIEQRTATEIPYSTVVGYASRHGIRVTLTESSALGRSASAKCREYGFRIDKINDPRFGTVGSYPDGVLREVFSAYYTNIKFDK